MGHTIEYITVNKKSEIMDTAEHFAWENVDPFESPSRDYHGRMTIHDNGTIYNSYEEAEEAINRFDRGFYDDHAVAFYDTTHLKQSSKVTKLQDKVKETQKAKEEYIAKNRVGFRKSAFIGCDECGSKMAHQWFVKEVDGTAVCKTDLCPVCRNDLRSTTVKERIMKFDDKIQELFETIRKVKKEEHKKNLKKAKVRWLVKVEVHC